MKFKMCVLLAFFMLVTVAAAATANLKPGIKAPDLTLSTADGKTFSLSQHLKANPSVLVMDICATWCGPCRLEIPHLIRLSNDLKECVTVVGVFIDSQKSTVADFVRNQKVPYTAAWDPNGTTVGRAYDVKGIPVTYIIDKTGVIRYVHTGFPSSTDEQNKEVAKYKEEINSLLETREKVRN